MPIFSDFSILNIVYWLYMIEFSLLTQTHAHIFFLTLSQYSSIYHKHQHSAFDNTSVFSI